MKIEIGEHSEVVLKGVYNPIVLISDGGWALTICMRDGGFEFSYGGNKYSAQDGSINKQGNYEQTNREISAQSNSPETGA